MPRKKAKKIKEVESFSNVLNKDSASEYKGKWNMSFFKNKNPIILELGCGKGEYCIGLAKEDQNINLIGIDRKPDRLWSGATSAKNENFENVLFIQAIIEDINEIFSKNEISEIWITFPDPQLKKEKLRLTAPEFLQKYSQIMKMDGILHLKTDEKALFESSLETIKQSCFEKTFSTDDLYCSELQDDPQTKITTTYEQKHISDGDKIFYIKAKLTKDCVDSSSHPS